jgi:hypothetical protein
MGCAYGKECDASNNSRHEGTNSLFIVKPISYYVLCFVAHFCERKKWLYLWGNNGAKYIHFTCKYAGGVGRSFA